MTYKLNRNHETTRSGNTNSNFVAMIHHHEHVIALDSINAEIVLFRSEDSTPLCTVKLDSGLRYKLMGMHINPTRGSVYVVTSDTIMSTTVARLIDNEPHWAVFSPLAAKERFSSSVCSQTTCDNLFLPIFSRKKHVIVVVSPENEFQIKSRINVEAPSSTSIIKAVVMPTPNFMFVFFSDGSYQKLLSLGGIEYDLIHKHMKLANVKNIGNMCYSKDMRQLYIFSTRSDKFSGFSFPDNTLSVSEDVFFQDFSFTFSIDTGSHVRFPSPICVEPISGATLMFNNGEKRFVGWTIRNISHFFVKMTTPVAPVSKELGVVTHSPMTSFAQLNDDIVFSDYADIASVSEENADDPIFENILPQLDDVTTPHRFTEINIFSLMEMEGVEPPSQRQCTPSSRVISSSFDRFFV